MSSGASLNDAAGCQRNVCKINSTVV